MTKNNWPTRLYSLDVSRGIAALAVVLWHWQHFSYIENSLPRGFQREELPLYNLLRMFYEQGALGVQYFFLLSGFIFFWLYGASIEGRKIGAWEFAIQRFSRLYPLHFITLLIVAFLQYFYTHLESVPFVYPFNDVYHFVLNLFFASNWGFEDGWSFNAPIWSVSVEILLYLVFFLVVLAHKGTWIFCLSVAVFSIVLNNFAHHLLLDGLASFFLGGYVFHFTYLISNRFTGLKFYIYLMAGLLWGCVIINYYITDLSHIILNAGEIGKVFLEFFPQYVLFPFTVCSLALLEIDKKSVLKSVSWIGDITYSSYLLHFPLQLVFGISVSLGLLNPQFYLDPKYLLIYFSILIPISYLTYVKFERPVQIMMRDRFLRSE